MRFAATLTVTGVFGYLVLEALKILLAPAALWLLAVAMLVVKAVFIGLAIVLFVVVAVWAYKRWATDPDEVVV